jgi:peptidoglycan/xylan/chitin deacetylase (PgdA/CDA1 family)
LQLALKVDVDTLRGTREGVPALIDALLEQGAGASFLFSVGPDRTGRAIRRVFRPGFFGKVARTSILEHYGVRTLLYGTLLPGPDISARAGAQMRRARAAGFETGVHCFDHTSWQDFVTRRGPAWTERQMGLAVARYAEVFGEAPRVHGAAGWQMNEAALECEEAFAFRYASDTRGTGPFIPLLGARRSACPQLPTTLPTLDELIGLDGVAASNVHEALLARTRDARAHKVFTLHAELEGMKLLPAFRLLLAGWREQGYELVSMAALFAALELEQLPVCAVQSGTIAGRSGTLAVQGPPSDHASGRPIRD